MDTPASVRFRAAFRQQLAALGYIEGKNIVIEERSVEGNAERLGGLARELAVSKVDIIVTPGVTASRAARQATRTIPIVMVHAGDPIGAGLIASLARPGGNATGLKVFSSDLGPKKLELLHEAVPTARSRHLCRPHPQGREASRPAGAAADQV